MIRLTPEPVRESLNDVSQQLTKNTNMKFYRRLNDVKAMTFDLDDTLYDNHPYIVAAEKQLFSFMFDKWPELESIGKSGWIGFRRECVQENPLLAHDMIALRRNVLNKLFASIGLVGAELAQAVEQSYDTFYFHRSNFKVPQDYVNVLNKLREHVPVLAITNGNVDIERVGLGDCFNEVFHASTAQRSKPHSDMFDNASEYLNIAPEHILHIGDNLEKDVAGALNAGYMTGWYAENRKMRLFKEKAQPLPHVELCALDDLLKLIA